MPSSCTACRLFHDTGTKIGKETHEKFGLEAMEVTNEVFESDASAVWDQAENRR